MKKTISVLLTVFILCFVSPVAFASTQSPAEQIHSMVYETSESSPELFSYISSINWIEEISLAQNVSQENKRDYTVNTDKVVGMYDLGNGYATNWQNNKDDIFVPQEKIWAFPYYYMGELNGAVVIFNTEPYTYSIMLDNSNRLLNLMFDADLLNTVLSNNDIAEIQDCKAILGTYSTSPSLIYINENIVLPVDKQDYNSIAAITWSEFVEKQSEAEMSATSNGLTGGGGGFASFTDLTNKKMKNIILVSMLGLFITTFFVYLFKKGFVRRVFKIRKYRMVAVSLILVLLFNIIPAGAFSANAESTDEILTIDDLPDAVYNAIKSEITEDTELTKDGQSDLYSITTTENNGTKTIFSFQEPIKFKDEDNKIRFKSDKVKKSNKLFSSYAFQSGENNITAYLPKRIKENVLLEYGDFEIKFKPVVNKNVKASKKTFTFHDATEEVVEYADVFGEGTALQYKPTMNGLKENIVLNQYNGQNTFRFYIDIGELQPAFTEGESIPLLDPDTDEIVYILGQVDARDSFVGDCPDTECHFTLFNSLKLEKDKKNGYILTITVDKEFLESETTVYPVVIDPILNINSSNMEDTSIYKNFPTTQTYYSSSYLCVGNHGESGEGRALIKLTNMSSFSSINPNCLIDVTYNVYEGSGRTTESIIQLIDPVSVWSANSVTWENAPGQYKFMTDMRINSSGWKEFSIESLFQTWLKNARNEGGFSSEYGFYLIANSNERLGLPESRHFCSSEHGTYKPYVKVTYNASTLEPGIYYLRNVQSGKYMDVQGPNTTSGTNVHQWQFHGGQSQQWKIIDAGGGYYYIRPMHAQTLSLDVQNNYSSDGSNIWVYGNNYTGDSAKWQIILNSHFNDGSYRLICKASGKAAVVEGASSENRANIFQYTYTTGEARNDDWILESVDTELGVQLVSQMDQNWCWAACGKMLASHYDFSKKMTQWSAAYDYYASIGSTDYSSGANPDAVEWVAEHITDTEDTFYSSWGYIYNETTLMKILRGSQTPVAILWGWLNDDNNRDKGHYVIIYGFYYDSSGNLILRIKDPASVNIGSIYTMSYDSVKRVDYERVWEAVVVCKVNYHSTTIPFDEYGITY